MLLRLLKYNTAAGYLLIPMLTVIAWWPGLEADSFVAMGFDRYPMPLYDLLTGYIPQQSLTARIVAMMLVIITGFYLIRLNNKYLFLQERTLMPAFFFIFIVSSFPELQRLHPALIAFGFLLAATDRLFDSYKTERLSYSIFEASFLIGVGSLFYFNLVWFNILVWLALLILRPVIWREWLFSLLGLAGPWVFFLATDFFLHDSLEWSTGLVSAYITGQGTPGFLSIADKIWLGFLLLLIIFASRRMIRSMSVMKVLSRKIFRLFFWIFAISIASYFFIENVNVEVAVPATFPVAFLFSHYILSKRKGFWANAILWSIIAGMMIIVWFSW